jgi:hypothetical protein
MLPPKIWVETSLIYIATSLNSTYHPLTVTQEIAGSSPVAPATPSGGIQKIPNAAAALSLQRSHRYHKSPR